MKTSILILVIISLISCTSPEKKIKDSFSFLREKRKELKIKSVEIYDTIYTKTVYDNMDTLQKKIAHLESHMRKRDSIFRKEKYDRELDILYFKQGLFYSLYSDMKDTIGGYCARIITPKDTFDIVVTPEFQFIGPAFLYNNENENERNIYNQRNPKIHRIPR